MPAAAACLAACLAAGRQQSGRGCTSDEEKCVMASVASSGAALLWLSAPPLH